MGRLNSNFPHAMDALVLARQRGGNHEWFSQACARLILVAQLIWVASRLCPAVLLRYSLLPPLCSLAVWTTGGTYAQVVK
jgi:hypothetical protein